MTKITLDSKKAYQKPTMNVVLLQHQDYLLAGSPQTLQGTSEEWQELE
ncbi:MAG: hypothetical protein IJ069_06420 [Prevotella sp.]|nr:hypothetical protein [Prevotella sp.]MBQ8153297.1 hypothetical protein [Prevotella sp.]